MPISVMRALRAVKLAVNYIQEKLVAASGCNAFRDDLPPAEAPHQLEHQPTLEGRTRIEGSASISNLRTVYD